MGGRSWIVTSLDWGRREAFVVPAETKGKSQWTGGRLGMSWRFGRAVHALLTSEADSGRWTARARDTFGSLRNQYDFLRPDADVVVTDREMEEVRWFTFAGGMINTALSDILRAHGFEDVSTSDFWIRVAGSTDAKRVRDSIRSKEAGEIRTSFRIADEFLENLKFNECLPTELSHDILRKRLLSLDELEATRGNEVVEVIV